LGRSFGLFRDHVLSLEIVDHERNFKEVTKATNSELFYAILGGSPRNFSVLTHFLIEVGTPGNLRRKRDTFLAPDNHRVCTVGSVRQE
jgi:hypothetical protein